MRRIVAMADDKKSEKSIQAKYKWYKRQYLPDFRKCVEEDGSRRMKLDQIERFVQDRCNEILRQHLPLKTYMIKGFGRRAARIENAPWFKASPGWVKQFTARNRLCSRKVTKMMSRPRIENQENIDESILEFYNNYTRLSRFFPQRMIWNIDQTGVEYESTNERVTARRGSRDVYLRVDSLNKNTHSFTAQPILSRDGRLLGKLILCMQEPNGFFGRDVDPAVRRLEREYGNIRVYASKSGKMTTQLMAQWMQDVMRPTIQRYFMQDRDADEVHEYEPEEEDRDCVPHVQRLFTQNCNAENWVGEIVRGTEYQKYDMSCEEIAEDLARQSCLRPYALLLADSWSGHSSDRMKVESRALNVRPLTIPPHTTDQLQPCDIGLFRQLKIFIRRITEEALVENRVREISSREGSINLMSIIYNQLQSPSYHDLWRYAWHDTDPLYSREELSRDPPANVLSIQFGFDPSEPCSVDNCTEHTVVRSSYTGETFCLTHFLERRAFHDVDHETNELGLTARFSPGIDDMEEDDEEEPLFLMAEHPPSIREQSTSSTTPDPLHEQVFGSCQC